MGANMTCNVPTTRGRPCRRPVRPGQTACAYHAADEVRQYGGTHDPAHDFYKDALEHGDLQALAEAAGLDGVDAELAIMRVLVRKVVSTGDVEAARRAVDTVARLVKIQHDLDATQTEHLTTSLDRVLDTLAQDLDDGKSPA